MRRVLVADLTADHVDASSTAHHLLRVLRAQPGERFHLLDGRGGAAIGELLEGAAFRVLERLVTPPIADRVLVLGIPKPALLEEALTLGTEGGATRFLLVRGRYSPPGEPRRERLDRVVRAAVTQCGRADIPSFEGPLSLVEAVALAPLEHRWIATPGGGAGAPTSAAAIAIGPEGGWDPDERTILHAAGFEPLGLGPFTLRTPSAVGAALAKLSPT